MSILQIEERERLYCAIQFLPAEKIARVICYIKSLEVGESEPPLTAEEEEGLRIVHEELVRGEGRSFEEAFKKFMLES